MADDFVTVLAPARLHLGFLDPGGRSGRRFGGIGLAIDEPATRLSVLRSSRDQAEGQDSARALRYLGELRRQLGVGGSHRVVVEEAIPAHAGLGSGTQLALAVSTGLRALEGLAPDVAGDAARLGRGDRSGLGAAFVTGGGIAVDGGKGAPDMPPPIVATLPFPEEWRVILVADPRTEGFHGEHELEAFARLPAFPESGVATICRLVLMQALPAVAEHDLPAFGAAIATIQEMVGQHFAPAQGGVFTSPAVSGAISALAAAGAHGTGQSSWGPTGFCFAASAGEAARIVRSLPTELAEAVAIRIVKGRNHGASVERRSLHRLTGTG